MGGGEAKKKSRESCNAVGGKEQTDNNVSRNALVKDMVKRQSHVSHAMSPEEKREEIITGRTPGKK